MVSSLNQVHKNIADLISHPSITTQLFSDWILIKNDHKQFIHKKHKHINNDMNVTLNLVKAGAGIALLTMSMVHRALQNGDLKLVLPPWNGMPREIHFLWLNKRVLSARAKLFRDELIFFYVSKNGLTRLNQTHGLFLNQRSNNSVICQQ